MRRTEELVRDLAREKVEQLEDEFFEQAALEIQKEILFECYMTVAPKEARNKFDSTIAKTIESANKKFIDQLEINAKDWVKSRLLYDIREIVESELKSFRRAVEDYKEGR